MGQKEAIMPNQPEYRTREHSRTVETTTALLEQKDMLMTLIVRATEPEELTEVVKMLQFVEVLWSSLDYGYKTKEIRDRIVQRAKDLIIIERDFLAGERKNSKVRSRSLADMTRLQVIIDTL